MSDVLAARVAQPDMQGMPEWQVAEILNAPDAAFDRVAVPVPVADARQVLMASLTPDSTTNAWVAILLTADDVANPARKPALAIREAIRAANVINMADPMEAAMVMATLNALIAAEVITEGTRDKLIALSQRQQSWAEANGVEVTPRTVSLTRGRI
jgi:hypothetical protein